VNLRSAANKNPSLVRRRSRAMVSSPFGNCPDASRDDLKGDSEMNHHDLITAPLAKFSSQVLPRGRLIKFYARKGFQQIRNLVERGKSREEIAELIEVTVGSLQVTCSKLGISSETTQVRQTESAFLHEANLFPVMGGARSDPSCDVSVPLQPIGGRVSARFRSQGRRGEPGTQTRHQTAGRKAKRGRTSRTSPSRCITKGEGANDQVSPYPPLRSGN